MVAYPASLATNNQNNLNRVPEDAETATGNITPSHGGMVTGYEFDIPVTQRSNQPTQQAPTPPLTPQPLPAQNAVPRPTSSSSNKPRPLSMPAQSNPPPASAQPDAAENVNGRTSSSKQDGTGSVSRSRTSNRILGDYTLSKTLGAGSMGKVKLALHNITGEKVRITTALVRQSHFIYARKSQIARNHVSYILFRYILNDRPSDFRFLYF